MEAVGRVALQDSNDEGASAGVPTHTANSTSYGRALEMEPLRSTGGAN